MIGEETVLKVVPFFDHFSNAYTHKLYLEMIRQLLRQTLPRDFFESDRKIEKLNELVPFVIRKGDTIFPGNISFISLSRFRANSFKFFFEMISRWLVPGERLNVVMIFAVDFYMPEIHPQIYTLCEIMIRVDDEEKLKTIERSFPLIESELKLGLESKYFANRILEIRGLSFDDKMALIQEQITLFHKKLHSLIDLEVFVEMQHFLLITPENFKQMRSYKHLSRLIINHYLFRKDLLSHLKDNPQTRGVRVKLFSLKKGLGISAGLTFFREKEVFEERQLMHAINNTVPQARLKKDSFIINRRGKELLTTVYLEIEKDEPFTLDEIKNLQKELLLDLNHHVEHLMHPIFMPRNEEEIMRNILTLSQQLKYTRDLPQVFISFDQQSRLNLFFTVIIVRVLRKESLPIQEKFKGSFLKYIHDRTKIVGHLRKKYSKEATVFRVKFKKEDYLRQDQSIDLYKARQNVVRELLKVLGEFRDFNGGMITKQNELFIKVKEGLNEEKIRFNPIQLENFFFSLTPVIMQTVLEPEALITLFKMLLDSVKKGLSLNIPFIVKMKSDDHFVYILFLSHERLQSDEFDKGINKFNPFSTDLASIDTKVNDFICTGYIFRSSDEAKRILFSHTVENLLRSL